MCACAPCCTLTIVVFEALGHLWIKKRVVSRQPKDGDTGVAVFHVIIPLCPTILSFVDKNHVKKRKRKINGGKKQRPVRVGSFRPRGLVPFKGQSVESKYDFLRTHFLT